MSDEPLSAPSRQIWDTNAAFWDATHGPDGNRFHRMIVEPAVLDLLAPQSGERIVELGCGNGAFARRLAGLGARLFARALRWAKSWTPRRSVWLRAVVAGAVLAGLVVVSEAVTGEPLALGPGYAAIEWALDPSRALGAGREASSALIVRGVGGS